MTVELGPLPEPTDMLQIMWRGDREFVRPLGDYFTADQMRAYAIAEVLKERERCATWLEFEGRHAMAYGIRHERHCAHSAKLTG